MIHQQPKQPPNSPEAEMCVLGGIMLKNDIGDMASILQPEDFYNCSNQTIYKALLRLANHQVPLDFVTVTEKLRDLGLLEDAGGVAYLGALVNDTPSAANLTAYAEIVKERATLRRLISLGGDVAEFGYRPDGRSAAELLDLAEQKVFAMKDGGRATKESRSLSHGLDHLEASIERLRANGGRLAGLSTGLTELDAKTTGLHPGELWIIAGRPGMAKTGLALNIAENVALYEKLPVAVFTLEMPEEQIALRMTASFARIPITALRTGHLDDRMMDRLVTQGGMLREAPVFVDDTATLTPLDLRAKARRLVAKNDVRLIIVDYLQLMTSPDAENRTNEIGQISRSLKLLAKELHVPVIALSQLNRGVENRGNKRPNMADIRDSGAIEADADLIAFIYRDEVYNPDTADHGIAEIIIGKQRNGPLGVVKTAFIGEYARFENLVQGYQDEMRYPAQEPPRRGLGRAHATGEDA